MYLSRRYKKYKRRTWRIQRRQPKNGSKAKAPIVPVAIRGTRDIFENNLGLRVCPSHVTISFGTPFKISELPAAEKKFAGEHAKQAIADMLAQQ